MLCKTMEAHFWAFHFVAKLKNLLINFVTVLYLPWYICLTNSCLLATVLTEQQTKFIWHCPWIMQNLFENCLFIQKACWWYTTNQTCNLFVLLSENFAGSCLKVFKSYDNFSIPGVHNICIILYVYDMRDSSAVARGGRGTFTKKEQTTKTQGGAAHTMWIIGQMKYENWIFHQ